ncbi:hypothetical protein GCM10010140_19530 [Streptosporangium pseudovulgare]|uniref:Secreted protein n=1 Tax=Streptosporangium pseudovulgare TaxID=35765 RepID=A0ABQ2QRA8_9ACTN|nr:hypothetical protein GCM10010140_19530 [Streptosporangium pseudovulgare]
MATAAAVSRSALAVVPPFAVPAGPSAASIVYVIPRPSRFRPRRPSHRPVIRLPRQGEPATPVQLSGRGVGGPGRRVHREKPRPPAGRTDDRRTASPAGETGGR